MRDMALQHRLRYRKDEDATYIVPGKRGHIGEWGDGRLYWVLVYDYEAENPTARRKEMAKQDPLLHLRAEADEEAVFLFSPADLPLVARRWCQARFRRRATALDLKNLRAARRAVSERIPPGESR